MQVILLSKVKIGKDLEEDIERLVKLREKFGNDFRRELSIFGWRHFNFCHHAIKGIAVALQVRAFLFHTIQTAYIAL